MLNSLYTASQKGDLSTGDVQNIFGNISGEFNAPLGKGYGLGFGFNTPSPMGSPLDG